NLQEIDIEIVSALKLAKDVYKKKRNYWNEKVKKLKDKKIEYKNILDSLIEEKKKFQNSNKSNSKASKLYTSIKQIERKIDNLERKIETDNLNINEENKIIDKIKELAERKQELLAEQKNDDLYKLERKMEIVKINLNKIYEQLSKWSNKSQDNHAKMLELYEQVNVLREKKRKMEEDLIENKKEADQYHEQYLELMNQKKKLNRNNRNKKPYRPRNRNTQRSRQKYKTRINQNNKERELLEKVKQDKLAIALEKQKAGKKLNLFEARLILEQNRS
ncbi:MAG: hypothetical protein ACTSQJ_13085, partial [Promethearchaeota archaeon]